MYHTITPTDETRRWILRGLAIGVIGIVAGAGSPAQARAQSDSQCPNVEVVFARGTFEAPGVGDTGQAFVEALTSRLGGKSVDVYPVDYPASLDFQEAAQGVIDASNKVESVVATCPHTKIVLGGYSQGAAVAGYTTSDTLPPGYVLPVGITGPMPATIAPHVVAVTLFGRNKTPARVPPRLVNSRREHGRHLRPTVHRGAPAAAPRLPAVQAASPLRTDPS